TQLGRVPTLESTLRACQSGSIHSTERSLHQSQGSSKTKTYNVLNVSVGTVNRSAAHRWWAWLRRNVRQVWLGERARPRQRQRRMDRLLTTIPSLSNSPLIRRAKTHSSLSQAPSRACGRVRVGRDSTASWGRRSRF